MECALGVTMVSARKEIENNTWVRVDMEFLFECLQDSHLLTLSLPTEEVFQLNGKSSSC